MHKPIKAFLCCLGTCIVFMAACNGPDANAGKSTGGQDAILQSFPFTAITDSIKESPKDAGLYFRRGNLLSQNNRHELAAADYKTAWNLRPDEETGLRYATTLSIINKPGEAIRLLKDAGRKFPLDEAFKRILGELYAQTGEIKEALALYDDMLKADSSNFEAWYEKGLLLEQAKDTAAAIAALQKAYTLRPVNTYTLELAHILAENRDRLALRLCDEVIAKDSAGELTDPFFIKGIYYSNTLQYKTAIVQFDSCIRRDWKFTEAYLEKGMALFKQKNYDEALNAFRMTATVSNTNPDAYFWIGRCYEASNKKEDAVQYYQRAIALDKNFIEAREALNRVKSP